MRILGIFMIERLKKYRPIKDETVAAAMIYTAKTVKNGTYIFDHFEMDKILPTNQ